MSSIRIENELNLMNKDPPYGCTVGIVNNNKLHWIATIIGPEKTPYEGGVFKLDITFRPDHPFKAPRIMFLTKIYHCNISKNGAICLDILKDQWSPALTISKVLLSICSLLAEPNPNDPLEPEIAKQLINNKAEHDGQAREYTIQYANSDEV